MSFIYLSFFICSKIDYIFIALNYLFLTIPCFSRTWTIMVACSDVIWRHLWWKFRFL